VAGGGPRVVAALLAALLLLAAAAPAAPGAGNEPSRQQELQAIRDEMARLQAELTAAGRRQSGLAGDVERATVELALQEQKVAEAQAARDLAAARIDAAEREVAALTLRLAGLRGDLQRSLVGLYRLGRHGYLRLLLSLEPGSSLLPGIRLLRFIARRDAAALDAYRATRDRLERERDRLAGERRTLEAWVGREEARRRELQRARRAQAALLARAEGERSRLAARASALRDKERKLAALVDLLFGRAAATLAGRPIQSYRGALDWPLRGRVTAGFGPRLDPRYGTRVPHNGIDIAAPGSEVRVVFPGKVLFAAPFTGYGPTVVVQHPGRVLTLYAGLAELRVAAGAVLSLGAPLGRAGATVYFEIRVENRPEDPALWLR
jgi:septal ring factor EnvC (AmiA/AmiB activator)